MTQQFRGHCQCCGRQQAVLQPGGMMAHHGYTRRHGWFEGTCSGHDFKPMEKERAQTDDLVTTIRAQCVQLRARATALAEEREDPEFIIEVRREARRDVEYFVPYCYGHADAQRRRRQVLVVQLVQRAEQGEGFARFLADLVDRVHGKKLIKVAKPVAPPPIRPGERRQSSSGLVLEATRVDGPRVYWKSGTRSAWLGTRAWRALPLVGASS